MFSTLLSISRRGKSNAGDHWHLSVSATSLRT
jgi:hypothetical protein